MPDFAIIDSHVHLCDPKQFGYSWTKNAPSLSRQVLPTDLTKAAGPVKIDRFVFVEVDVDYPQHLKEAAWVAELYGERVGAVFCVRQDDRTAKLRLLHVEPSARGAGVGTVLVDECVRFARAAGYEAIVLWTVSVLEPARRIYQRAGFELVEDDTAERFGQRLTGQTWRLELGRVS